MAVSDSIVARLESAAAFSQKLTEALMEAGENLEECAEGAKVGRACAALKSAPQRGRWRARVRHAGRGDSQSAKVAPAERSALGDDPTVLRAGGGRGARGR